MCVYQRRRKKKCAFPSRSRRRSNGKKASTERERGASRLFFVSSLFSSETISRSSAMNSLLIFRLRALSIGSLLFLSSLRARDWKKKKKCGESLFAFAPLGEEREKKILRRTTKRQKQREEEESRDGGEKQKIPNNERVCWPSLRRRRRRRKSLFRKNNNNSRGVNLNKTHAGTRPFDDDIAVLVSGTLSREHERHRL